MPVILRRAWRMALALLRAAAWIVGTAWLGAKCIWRCGVVLAYLDEIVAERLPCSRGHRSPVFGVYECRCGAVHEGWAFGRCRVCGQSAAWTLCLTCGLPVVSPLRRWEL